MDRYCPECNSTMTPSLVGYLCVNCGHAQRFYSAQEAALATPKTPTITSTHSNRTTSKTKEKHISQPKRKNKSNNKVKSTLKRLMVPEIAPPHPHLIGEGDDNIKPVLADKIIDEQEMPAMIDSKPSNSELMHQDTQTANSKPAIETDTETHQSGAIPNQSSNLTELESALHPQKNTSIWVMLGLALLMLIVAAAVLFLIILS